MKRRGLNFWAAILAILALTALALPAAAGNGDEGSFSWQRIWAAIVEMVGGFGDEPEYQLHPPVGGGAEAQSSTTPPPDDAEDSHHAPVGG